MQKPTRAPALALAALAVVLPLAVAGGGGTPIDPTPIVAYRYGPKMTFGVSVLKTPQGKPVKKLLTYADDGNTNSTMVRIGGKDEVFGGPGGKWVEKGGKIPAKKVGAAGTRSVWASGSIHVTQILRILPSQAHEVGGSPKRFFDTVRVHYILENKGAKPRKAALRVMLDTLIGGNDGVPFTVPGQPGLVTVGNFAPAADVPDFIEALERSDLDNPGTVAHLTLKMGGNFEPPGRVSLTAWVSNPGWEVPVREIGQDSAVVMYWAEKNLKPGEKRHLGFAYGLGGITSKKGSPLGVTVGGAFEQGTQLTVTAYVHGAKKGQTVELTLPNGLELIQGQAKVNVPPPPPGKKMSIVTWKARAQKIGQYTLRVQSSTGPTLTRIITITERQKGSAAAPFERLPVAGLEPPALLSAPRTGFAF